MRYTPEQFRALTRARGYTRRTLANAWGLTPPRITQITNDPHRAAHYDYALWGMPQKRAANRVSKRRFEVVSALVEGGRSHQTSNASATRKVSTEIEPGDIWVVRESPGEHLPEGCLAEVIGVSRVGGEAIASLRFQTGEEVTYPLSYMNSFDCYLSPTGRSKHTEL